MSYKTLKKWLIWERRQEKKMGCLLPRTNNMAEIQEVEDVPLILLPCAICGRTFKPEVLSKHTTVCERQHTKKRKKFDSAKQRIQGTELAEFLGPPPLVSKPKPPSPKKVQSRWKEKHEALKRIVRDEVKHVKPVDHSQCPHCDRFFGPKAFDRHVAWCKEQLSKIHVQNEDVSKAKQRLQARTKYRAPSFKSQRSVTKEKYSPMRSGIIGSTSSTFPSPPVEHHERLNRNTNSNTTIEIGGINNSGSVIGRTMPSLSRQNFIPRSTKKLEEDLPKKEQFKRQGDTGTPILPRTSRASSLSSQGSDSRSVISSSHSVVGCDVSSMASTATATPLHETKPTIKTSYSTNRKGKKSETKSETRGAKRWKRKPEAIEEDSCQAPAYDLDPINCPIQLNSNKKNSRKLWTRLKAHSPDSFVVSKTNSKIKKGKAKSKKSKVVSPVRSSSSHKTIILSENQNELDSFCEENDVELLDDYDIATEYYGDYFKEDSQEKQENSINSKTCDINAFSATFVIDMASKNIPNSIQDCEINICSLETENGTVSPQQSKDFDVGESLVCCEDQLESELNDNVDSLNILSLDNEILENHHESPNGSEKYKELPLPVSGSSRERDLDVIHDFNGTDSDSAVKMTSKSDYDLKLKKPREKLTTSDDKYACSERNFSSKIDETPCLLDGLCISQPSYSSVVPDEHAFCNTGVEEKNNEDRAVAKKKSCWNICLNRKKKKKMASCKYQDIISVIKNKLDLLSKCKCLINNNNVSHDDFVPLNEQKVKIFKNSGVCFSCSDSELYSRKGFICKHHSVRESSEARDDKFSNYLVLPKSVNYTTTYNKSTQTCFQGMPSGSVNSDGNVIGTSLRGDAREDDEISVRSSGCYPYLRRDLNSRRTVGTFGMDSRLKDVRRLLNRCNAEKQSNDDSVDYFEDDRMTNCGSVNDRISDTEETMFIQSIDQQGNDCDVVLTSVKRLSNPREKLNRRIAMKEWRLTQSGFSASSCEPWFQSNQNEVKRVGGDRDAYPAFFASSSIHLPPLGNSTPKRDLERYDPFVSAELQLMELLRSEEDAESKRATDEKVIPEDSIDKSFESSCDIMTQSLSNKMQSSDIDKMSQSVNENAHKSIETKMSRSISEIMNPIEKSRKNSSDKLTRSPSNKRAQSAIYRVDSDVTSRLSRGSKTKEKEGSGTDERRRAQSSDSGKAPAHRRSHVKSSSALPQISDPSCGRRVSSPSSPFRTSPSSAFFPVETRPKEPDSKTTDNNNDNSNDINQNDIKMLSLSTLSLCSEGSLETLEPNLRFRSLSAAPRQTKQRLNMHDLLFGFENSNEELNKSLNNNDNNDSSVKTRKREMERCEAQLLRSMVEFELLLNRDNHSPSSPPPPPNHITDSAYSSLNRRWSPSGIEQTSAAGNVQDDPAHSKFCHECGGRYPVPGAKFCCLCGVRRLAI